MNWRDSYIFTLILTTPTFAADQTISKSLDNTAHKSQYEQVHQLIKNRALASGLSSGIKSLNRTVETLMESLFYNIMDQEFPIFFTNSAVFNPAFQRDVHETSLGSFIVVDKFQLGPEFEHTLSKVGTTPIKLGGDGKVVVTNIYHRSDPVRSFEKSQQPMLRYLASNWFGLLPVLSAILPPSFNATELYDPISYLLTPFLIPETPNQALKMPIGNIRSFGLTGGITVAGDIFEPLVEPMRKHYKIDSLDISLPYAVFKTGTHTVSIMRKSNYVFWVLVSDARDFGHRTNSLLGTSFRIFEKLIPLWKGIKVPITPIDVLFYQAQLAKLDQLYTFDFRYGPAREAYRKALKGDFSKAYSLHQSYRRHKQKNGVRFEFSRLTEGTQTGSQTERSFFVQQASHGSLLTKSEIEIVDQYKKSHIITASHTSENLNWDVLVGAEKTRIHNKVELKVLKRRDKNKTKYVFDPYVKSPLQLSSQLQISDRFTDSREFQKAIELIRYYLALPLDQIPMIPVYAHDRQVQQSRLGAMQNPMDDIYSIKIAPTHLGKMSLNAQISFPSSFLKEVTSKPPRQIRSAMALAYGMDSNYWSKPNLTAKLSWWFQLAGANIIQPLKLLNIRIPQAEFVREVENSLEAIKMLKSASSPLEYLDSFHKLLDSAYPIQIIRTISLLGDYRQLPRRITFQTSSRIKSADSTDTKSAKKKFQQINGQVIKSKVGFPQPFQSKTIDEKIASFDPNNFVDSRVKPAVSKLTLMSHNDQNTTQYQVKLDLNLVRRNTKTVFVYVKLEQSGSVNIGRLHLFEKVLKLAVNNPSNQQQVYFPLNGAYNPFQSPIADTIIGFGGSFNLHLAVSAEGHIWSDVRVIRVQLTPEKIKFL